MATIQSDSEREQQWMEDQLAQMAPMISSGAAGTGGGGPLEPGAGSGGQMPGVTQPGAEFVSLQQRVAANEGQTGNLGMRIGDLLRGSGDAARTGLADLSGRFDTAVDQSTVRLDPEIAQRIQGGQAAAVAGDQAQRDAVIRARDARYDGPSSLETFDGYGGVIDLFGTARNYGQLAQNETGIAELSDKAVGGRRSASQRALDSQLLLGDQEARSTIDEARGTLGDLDERLGTASQSALDRVGQARQETDQTRTNTRDTLQSSQDALQKAIDDRVGITRQQAEQRSQQAQQAVANPLGDLPTTGAQGLYDPRLLGGQAGSKLVNTSLQGVVPRGIAGGGDALVPQFQQYVQQAQGQLGNVDPGLLADLGVTPEQYRQLLDLAPVAQAGAQAAAGTTDLNPYAFLSDFQGGLGDLSRFVTTQNPDAQITRGNVATGADYDNLGALGQLSGNQSTFLNPNERSLAGTASTDLVDFNIEDALAQREAVLRDLQRGVTFQHGVNARDGSKSFF